ncbi:MAG TPA: cation-transporting P-type ATPase [Solirubrobacterales bacterium]|nr:cation-transporting P-type ATPase [Solirubrobacterales bacterium]
MTSGAPRGLTSREAERRLTQYGRNEVVRRGGPSRWGELGRQFAHPLALLLWAAAGLAVVAGNVTLAVAIVAVIVLNAVLAFFQEAQAERATEALGALLPPQVRVRRDGRVTQIEAGLLVPGDLTLLAEGDRISADATLLNGAVEVDMSPLTGESEPVTREAGPPAPPGRRNPLEDPTRVFAGTLCTQGEAEALVTATAMHTQLGRIAALTQRVRAEVSPLQEQVNRAAWLIAAIAVASGVVFFLAGISLAGLSISFALTAAIGLLVGNVPEGLLPTITLALAGAVRRMARRRALVKRLTAVETLGSTDVICTDKTGTLTEGKMAAHLIWADGVELPVDGVAASEAPTVPDLPALRALAQTAVLCNNATLAVVDGKVERHGDPSESALLEAALMLGDDPRGATVRRSRVRRRVFAFDPHVKRMSTLDAAKDGSLTWHVKGAPGELLELCTEVMRGEEAVPLDEAARSEIQTVFDGYASHGLRVLGFAQRAADAGADGETREQAESGLTFLGLVALEDPLRPEVVDAVARCRRARIRIVMVTGDHGLTAAAIARQAGIVGGHPTIITGEEVESLPQEQLDRLLHQSQELIVARSNPETKLHLVDALRAEGHTVAMTGDGVNDAPALRRADIGVAMGASGTDVAREAATMVLTDDNFASIVAAVEEGRVVYDNVRKFITYIFAHAPAESIPFAVFVLSGGSIPLPLLPLQILAIDLGTDTVPALALGREPAEPGIMERPPRPRKSGIIQRSMLARAWLRMGLVEAGLALLGFFVVLLSAGWGWGAATGDGSSLHHAYLQATSMTWAGIVACQIGAGFACRTTAASLRQIGVFSNRHLLRGVLFELCFAAAIIYAPPLQALFHTAGLDLSQLALLATFPFLVWGSDEAWRARRRRAASAVNPQPSRPPITDGGRPPG